MKNLNKILFVAGFLATNANAGIFVDAEVGAKGWLVEQRYNIEQKANRENFSDEYSNRFGAMIEGKLKHAIPFVPNIGGRFTYINNKNGSDSKISHLDVDAFYSILDITPISIDLGIGAKIGDFKVVTGRTEDINYNDVTPYFYGNSTLDIFGTPLSINANIRASDLNFCDKTKLFDGELGLSWNIADVIIQGNIVAGYRYLYLKQDTSVADDALVIFKGPYLGLKLNY